MFGWEFPPHITGGLGTACFGLTKGLLMKGAEIIFVVPKAYGDEERNSMQLVNASDIEIDLRHHLYQSYWKNLTYIQVGAHLIPYVGLSEYFDVETKIASKVNVHDISSLYKRKFAFSGQYRQNLMEEVMNYAMVATTIATQHSFDVIHAHDWLTYEAGIAAKKATGKPLVIHVHATEFDRSGEHVNQAVFDIERHGMQEADKIITVSNLTRKIVIERYGINPAKVTTVYNAVEPVEIKNPLNVTRHLPEKIVTFLGRVTFQKGPEYFVEAAHLILQKNEHVRFVMAGDGDLLPKVVRRIAQLGMGTKFHFTGFLKGQEVDKMFAMSDVYVMPSVSEPFGISPLEAMRSHVPVVISKQSGVSEILKHALKVDFWDVDAMADAIHGLLKYDALSKTFRKKGTKEVDALKWENAAAATMKVYNQAIHQ